MAGGTATTKCGWGLHPRFLKTAPKNICFWGGICHMRMSGLVVKAPRDQAVSRGWGPKPTPMSKRPGGWRQVPRSQHSGCIPQPPRA